MVINQQLVEQVDGFSSTELLVLFGDKSIKGFPGMGAEHLL